MTTAQELTPLIKGDVTTDSQTLDTHSRDASLFVVRPQVVVFPKDTDDVKRLVEFVSRKKNQNADISLTARAAGTDMSGGPLSESVVVSFTKYFNRPPIVDQKNKTAVAEPGVFYRDFEPKTLAHDLILPSYPASRELCAIGGIVNNNSGGERTLRYGKTEKFVKKMKVVLADAREYTIEALSEEKLREIKKQKNFQGHAYKALHILIKKNYDLIQEARPKVSKNSAGYNLWDVWDKKTKTFDPVKLFVGAQGTLGLMTEATFDLVPTEKHSRMVIAFLDRLDNLGDLVNAVLKHRPETFESYDDKTLKLAFRFFGSFVKKLGWKNIFGIAWHSLPEFGSIVRHGFPKLVLQITFSGNDSEDLARRALRLKNTLQEFKPRYVEIIRSETEAEQYWLIRRESFNLLRHKIKDKKTAPFVDDVVVDPEHYPQFLPKLNAILDSYKKFGIIYTVAGHVGNGNFHVIPLMNLSDKRQRAIIPEISKRVYDLVHEYNGSITGEHNDGIIRTPYLEQMFGREVCALFEEVKNIFDPLGIFNPGKKVGGSLEYALRHIRND